MSGALLGVLVLALLAGTGALLAATARVERLPEFVLAAYVIAYGSVVALCLLLSLFEAMTRTALVVGSALIMVAAVAVWWRLGARWPASVSFGALRLVTRRGPVLAVGIVVMLALAYDVALILGTPPNGADQLNYHLPRAAFWVQAHRIGYVPNAYDQRLDSFAPNGEIGIAFALEVTQNEIFAACVQFIAALACATGIFALARRFALSRAEAALGALLFLALPIVLLQAASTENDLVLASFLVAATVFVLREGRPQLALAGLSTALAVGAKFTGLYGVLVLLALVLLGTPRVGRTPRLVALAAGTVAGSYWYGLNLAETGKFFGSNEHFHGLTAVLKPAENLYALLGLPVDSVDVSGARGADIFFYAIAALLVAAALAATALRTRNPHWSKVLAAACLVASPLLLYVLEVDVGKPVLLRWRDLLGDPPAYIPGNGNPGLSPTLASDTGSWYGPVGFMLLIGVGVAAIVLVRRRALPRLAAGFALTPVAWWVLVGLSLTYLPWQGRFFLYPVVLSASLWGLLLRVPQLAWAIAAVAAVSASLTLVHYAEKPSGIRLLARAS